MPELDEFLLCELGEHEEGAAHSWDVTDPLADLMTEQIREEVRRDREGDGGGSGGRG
ncbi:hypothetical protein [Streptomyces rubiginosohelvolus]|uniref:hypothetical protein n=1 Tax=Streptomyces rubiginosohelvolus TaxID=67362 RepID=UPI0036C81997